MQASTFRDWLAERGHSLGHAVVTVEREGRTAELPLVGSHERLDPGVIREVCERLGLDWNALPGPRGRA